MNLPNFLTVSRIALTFLFVFALLQNSLPATFFATLIFILAALTDFWDGYFAKKRKLTSDFGAIMDPIADKFLILAAFWIFVRLGIVHGGMVLLILIREVAVTASRLFAMRRGRVLAAEKAGKIKTVLQITTISLILLFLILEKSYFLSGRAIRLQNSFLGLINFLMIVTVGLTLFSGYLYFVHKRKMNEDLKAT